MKRPEQRGRPRPYHGAMTYMTRSVRAGIALAILAVVGWLGGCSDNPGGPVYTPPPEGLVLSDPVSTAGIATAVGMLAAPASGAADEVAYVSLAPGTVPTGTTAIIRRVGDARSVVTAVFDGGFDPVPVGAGAGDSIDVVVRDAAGGTVLQARLAVAARRPPIIVRTDPPRKKTDVPLNAAIVVVFSEPVAGSSVTTSSVQLLRGTTTVPGTVGLLGGSATAAVFTPAALLEANTDYQLVVTEGVTDLGGAPLEAVVTVEFTTGTATVRSAYSVTVLPDTAAVAIASQVQLSAAARDSGGYPISGRPVAWFSETPAVATVSTTGLATAVAEGEARVRADVDFGSGVAILLVTARLAPVDSVDVGPASAVIIVGGRVDLTAVLRDAAGNTLSFRQVAWTTSNAAVATVGTPSGSATVVTGIATGTATITATSEGRSGRAAITVVSSGPYEKLAVGDSYACGITVAGRALCWGSNHSGNLGNGTSDYRDSVPAEVAGGLMFSEIEADHDHVCALTPGGVAYCWGASEGGKLGTGSATGPEQCPPPPASGPPCSTLPVAVAGGLTFIAISAGGNRTCALKSGGAAYCWGSNAGSASLGTGSTSGPEVCFGQPCSTVPVAVWGGLTFTSISAGSSHTCAIASSGAAYCWGSNYVGQLGTGSSTGPEQCGGVACSTVPVAVTGGLTFTAISVGHDNTCGVTPDGSAYCWGVNHLGQLGVGTSTGPQSCSTIPPAIPCSPVPVRIPGSLRWAAIGVGGTHACALTASGAAYCWGANEYGALGMGTGTGPEAGPQQCGPPGNLRPCSPSPVAVSGGLAFARISVYGSTCGVTLAGIAYCWGFNQDGQLGNGAPGTHSSVPVRVSGQP